MAGGIDEVIDEGDGELYAVFCTAEIPLEALHLVMSEKVLFANHL